MGERGAVRTFLRARPADARHQPAGLLRRHWLDRAPLGGRRRRVVGGFDPLHAPTETSDLDKNKVSRFFVIKGGDTHRFFEISTACRLLLNVGRISTKRR